MRGPLTILDLHYGKEGKGDEADLKLKLVMIMLEQLLENKDPIKSFENTINAANPAKYKKY